MVLPSQKKETNEQLVRGKKRSGDRAHLRLWTPNAVHLNTVPLSVYPQEMDPEETTTPQVGHGVKGEAVVATKPQPSAVRQTPDRSTPRHLADANCCAELVAWPHQSRR